MRLIILACSVILVAVATNAQTVAPRIIDSSAVRIITKVPFNGMNYFITIVPVDSTNIDNMPILDPSQKFSQFYVWRDSLQRMLPDSILKLLPQKRDFLTPRKPRQ